MPTDMNLHGALLDSWNRNNTIMLNLLQALPESSLGMRVVESSPTIAETFTHIIYIRLVHVFEDAPEFSKDVPEQEWRDERDKEHIALMLNESAKAVRKAVEGRIQAGKDMNLHYDHPILMLQHLIWHEGYHHGQIKLALKLAGHPISDEEVGVGTWGIWMDKKKAKL
jgi:uncharacterized damage-inducible protein DinB